MEELCLKEPGTMSATAAIEFRKAYVTFRAAMNYLAEQAIQSHQCRYLLRPKIHQLSHICLHFIPQNPRYFQNYLDEDFVNLSKRLAEKSHPLFMSLHVVQRYCISVTLRWNGNQFD